MRVIVYDQERTTRVAEVIDPQKEICKNNLKNYSICPDYYTDFIPASLRILYKSSPLVYFYTDGSSPEAEWFANEEPPEPKAKAEA